MRPLSLDVQGFTCFRDPQPTLDLSALSLFAITGPTGAGKSSVLDAITFALYGRVPRMGGASVKDLISHGRDRMTVTLRFGVRDRQFLVTRVVRRTTTAGSCQLDEIVDGLATPIASGAREVAAAVERLVGLDYEAFTHAVILPQGEFARFLKGDPAQRRRILQELLRLTVYGRMQKLAGERCRHAKRDLDLFTRQIGEHADATPAAIAAAEEELRTLAAAQPALRERCDAARQRCRELETALARQQDHDAARQALAVLHADEPAHVARHQRLDAGARAARVAEVLATVAREEAARDRCRATHVDAHRRLEVVQARAVQATAALEAAQVALAALAPARAQIVSLQSLEGRLAHRDALLGECRVIEADVAGLEAERQDKVANVRLRERHLEEAQRERDEAERRLAASRFDQQELLACERGQAVARELRSAREQAPALAFTRRQAEEAAREAARIAAAESVAFDEARQALARAETERVEATRRLAEAQDAWRAMTLRGHLHAGATCPVCEQAVAVVPPVHTPPALAELMEADQECAEACRVYALGLEAQRERHVRAAAAAEGTSMQSAAAETARVAHAARITASVDVLTAQLHPYLPASSASMPEHWLLERLDTLQAQRAQHEQRARQAQLSATALRDAEHAVVLARQALDACTRAHAARAAQAADKRRALDALDAEIRAVTPTADPRAELSALLDAVADAEGRLDAARVTAMRHETARAAASEAEALARAALVEADTTAARATTALADALRTHGFETPAQASDARLTPGDEAALREACDTWTRDVTALATRLQDLERELGTARVTWADVEAARHAERDAETAATSQVRRQAQVEMQLDGMRARLLQVASLQTQAVAARVSYELHARLSADLKADAFQAWLLREAFERIVAGASVRLMELSGRYTLRWEGDAFCVIDHDNAQEQRPADTLSGGETFLASLALALELSEQVQRAAGAVRLDSLFIDEGFGTLDASAQDTVAAAIESLQVTGRVVGIITHVRELTDRMPACVVIDKRPDGSRWRVR